MDTKGHAIGNITNTHTREYPSTLQGRLTYTAALSPFAPLLPLGQCWLHHLINHREYPRCANQANLAESLREIGFAGFHHGIERLDSPYVAATEAA